tara:strand:+ start:4961 stop:5176 length:216 start_codon:yes stop_codon:yes gene_type:complete
MSCISLTETGLLALISLVIGFLISFCKQAEQSRCKEIQVCYGLINCKRDPLNDDTILEMEEGNGETKNNEN